MPSARTAGSLALAAALSLLAGGSGAAPAAMPLGGPALPPIGYLGFCRAHPADCDPYDRPHALIVDSAAVRAGLAMVTADVNHTIAAATDVEVYGVAERWDYPQRAGDCEDLVLEKRRRLIAAGWPASALLITVVRDEAGAGHAVLTVRLDRGDVVLDNKTDRVRAWTETPYAYLERQSAGNPMAWDRIGASDAPLVGALR